MNASHDLATTRRTLLKGLAGAGAMLALSVPHGAAAQSTPPSGVRIPLGEALPDLAPRAVWQHFHELTQIPRPSHHEAEVSAFLAAFGDELGLKTEVDEVGNVIIRKPDTAGMEDRQGVVLQAHMDMVGIAEEGSDHVFESDPIEAYVDGGWVRAEGTTLGADNGIGVAMIMALLEADDVAHGPLEALFTVNEEDGFTGANAVQPDVLHGTMLINIDSEEEGIFTIGSAGGVNVDATLTYTQEPVAAGMVGIRLDVAGMQGGHSGIDIDKGRGNAIKLLARLLNALEGEIDVRLASMTGGDRYNAIPLSASAVVALDASQGDALRAFVDAFAETVRAELAATEPELRIEGVTADAPVEAMAAGAQRDVIDALNAVPNGVVRMSDSVPGLVETSTNLGTIALGDGQMQAGFLVRSSIDSARDAVAEEIASAFALAGAEASLHDSYSGWQPNPDSPLLALMQETWRDLFGTDAGVMAVHAGLETSAIGATYPGMDMISIGPTLQNVHSPDEQLEIASVGTTWELLVAALERIPA
jgi:dipeptidase D